MTIQLQKNHETINLCYEKSQPSEKKSQKIVNLYYKKSKLSDKNVTKM